MTEHVEFRASDLLHVPAGYEYDISGGTET